MTNTPTISEVVAQVRLLAEEQPDFIYTEQPEYDGRKGCGYIGARPHSTEGQGCIVGQALTRLGVSQDFLYDLDGQEVPDMIYHVAAEDDPARPEIMDPLVEWLLEVQEAQDAGIPWAQAVAAADES